MMHEKEVMKKSILLLSHSFRPNIGGVETHLEDLTEYLRNNGHRVFVITYQPLTTRVKGQKLEMKKNLEIHRIEGYWQKQDRAWWFHIPACWITMAVYTIGALQNKFSVNPANRRNWQQQFEYLNNDFARE